MAKTVVKEKSKVKPVKTVEAPSFKYGIAELAKFMGLKEASVRVKLRNANIPRTGKAYGWNSKDDMESVASQLKGGESKASKKAA
jgi:hypothetical protein